MFIVYVQCHTCGRKEWATKAELDWFNVETGKRLGRRYRARHGEGVHRCPGCQDKHESDQVALVAAFAKEPAADLRTEIEPADSPDAPSAEGLVLPPVGSHEDNPFSPGGAGDD